MIYTFYYLKGSGNYKFVIQTILYYKAVWKDLLEMVEGEGGNLKVVRDADGNLVNVAITIM